jgi:hypothetical protein
MNYYHTHYQEIEQVNFKPLLDCKTPEEKEKSGDHKTYNDTFFSSFFGHDVLKKAVRTFTDMIFQNIDNYETYDNMQDFYRIRCCQKDGLYGQHHDQACAEKWKKLKQMLYNTLFDEDLNAETVPDDPDLYIEYWANDEEKHSAAPASSSENPTFSSLNHDWNGDAEHHP